MNKKQQNWFECFQKLVILKTQHSNSVKTLGPQLKTAPMGGLCYLGWGARIRTMIKRTKISCPTIRRHPKSILIIIIRRNFAIIKNCVKI